MRATAAKKTRPHLSMRLNLIYAQARNGVIGIDNRLPWHLPQDLAHFKAHTSGCPVIMGRKTWDSLPPKFRPLPGRINIVVTRQSDWQGDGAVARHSLPDAITHLQDSNATEVWVIGGAQIYEQALPLAQRAVVTVIHKDFDGDAFAPTLPNDWVEVTRDHHPANSVDPSGLGYDFVIYERTPAAIPT